MSDIAIKVENLSKSYRIRKGEAARYTALRDVMVERAGQFFHHLKKGQNPFFPSDQHETFWALDDVSFEVKQGEVMGVIGRNGAGKSTLLKILSRITEPDKGRITLNGRVASLLEVGTGFHPELTGRENIYLSGAILGMRRDEIKKRFDEIVDFAGVEKFLDTPVKRYSSGMYVRLGFAVAAHLETEILLVDEVLAVGDVEFQRKCMGKMGNLYKDGKSVIIVSHNMSIIQKVCDNGLFIERGMINFLGKIDNVVSKFNEEITKYKERLPQDVQGDLRGFFLLKEIILNNRNVIDNDFDITVSGLSEIIIKIVFKVNMITPIRINLALYKDGIRLFTLQDLKKPEIPKEDIQSKFRIPSKLLRKGIYSIGVGGIESDQYGRWFWIRDVIGIEIIEEYDEQIEFVNYGVINVFSKNERLQS